MVSTWKIKGRGMYGDDRIISSKYFISKNCVSCGWGSPVTKHKEYIKDFQTYKEKWLEMYGEDKKWGYQGVHHLFESVKKGDFLWTRLNGEYYVAQVPEDPITLFHIDYSDEALQHDSTVQLKNIKWLKCGTEDTVPGSISSFTSNRNSIVKVDKGETIQDGYTATSIFSAKILNPNFDLPIKDKRMVFNFIGPSGFEDIIALWLYDRFNYVVIPSTNKKSTQTYEFVLVDGSKVENRYQSSRRVYLQAKNGENDLFFKNYTNLLQNDIDEVWLVTSRGNIYGLSGEKEKNQIVRYKKTSEKYEAISFDLKLLIDFIFDTTKNSILPESIKVLTKLFK